MASFDSGAASPSPGVVSVLYFAALRDLAGTGEERVSLPRLPTSVEALLYEAIFDFTEWEKVSDCPVPLRIVYGDSSGRIPPGEDPLPPLRKLFPRVEMRVLPDATHSGPMEHPEAFEDLIRDFAASLP